VLCIARPTDIRNVDQHMKRQRFLTMGASFVATAMAGCGGGGVYVPPSSTPSSSTKQAPTPSTPPSTSPTANTTIAISRAQTIGAVAPTLVGLSIDKRDMTTPILTPANTTLIGCLKRLGTNVARIGSADETQWTPNGAGETAGQIAPSDISALAEFVKQTGWSVIYGINLASNTPSAAAAEAAYASNALGTSLLGFEIGNECDLYNTNGTRPSSYNVQDFITEWNSYVSAIRESVPNAVFTGPASALHESTWTATFAAAQASQLAMVTQHYYRAGGTAGNPDTSLTTLLSGDPGLPIELQSLKGLSAPAPLGYRISECNSFNDGGIPGASNAYGSALWAADFLLVCAQNGAAGVNLHNGEQDPSYAPIYVVGTSVVGIAPEYYGMLFVSQIAPGPMYPVAISGPALATAYAIAGNDGATYLAIINKDASTTCSASIALGANVGSAQVITLTGPALTSLTGTELGGATVALDGSWAANAVQNIAVNASTMSYNVPPATAALLKLV
jgi:hypothetical protein